MAELWFYRMFGQDFGPVTFEELRVLAESGTISKDDEVREESAFDWKPVRSVRSLSSGGGSFGSDAYVAVVNDSGSNPAVPQDWYCMLHGQEMGPLSFEDLLDFARQGQVGPDDEVKLGASGKWRRIGSIGRLVAVLPYLEKSVQISPAPPPKPLESSVDDTGIEDFDPQSFIESAPLAEVTPAELTTVRAIPQPAPPAIRASAPAAPPPVAPPAPVPPAPPALKTDDLAFIKAQAAYEATEQAAIQLVSWAFSPNCDPKWWAVMHGNENGPVDFKQIFQWAITGRLQPSDYVRNGIFGQYGPVANLPGLFSAVGIMKPANDSFQLAKTRALNAGVAIAGAAAPPAAPTAPVAPTVQPVAPIPVAPPTAVAAPNSVTAPATPPAAPAPQPAPAPVPAPAPKPAESRTPAPPEVPKPQPASSSTPPRPTPQPMSLDSTAEPRPTPMSASSGGMSTAGSSSASISRPMPTPPKPSKPAKRSSGSASSFDFAALLKGPALIGGIAVGVITLLVVGWMALPAGNGADIQRYRDLKKLLDDVRAKRDAKATDFGDLQARAKKMSKEFATVLKKEATADYPHKQQLLWAARDELPLMMKGDLTTESKTEKEFADRLTKVSQMLKVDK